MKPVKVIEVKQAPQLKNLATLSGIRDKDAARAWGEKNGYAVVYFVASKQRVYADRLLVTAEMVKRTIRAVEAL